MGALARVQRAIEAPTAEAQKLLAEAPHADAYERLTILMSGWFRGLTAALEELAIELDAIRDQREPPPSYPQAKPEVSPPELDEPAPRAEPDGNLGEEALAERARASRAETRALREERDE